MEKNEQHLKNNVIRFEPVTKHRLIRNSSDLLEAARANDVDCLIMAYRCKNGVTRTYRFGDTETLFFTLELLKRDLLEEYCEVGDDGE